MHQIEITDTVAIGHNDRGYYFWVGQVGSRWIGFASESPEVLRAKRAFGADGLGVDPSMLFLFPEVSDGYDMGLRDRDKAIRLTGAVAQAPESAYGGIDHWHVPEALRGQPDDFRCAWCDRVGCDGVACQEDGFNYDPFAEDGA